MDKSFCGRIMEVSVSFPEDSEYAETATRNAYLVGEFRCTAESLSFREGEKYERTKTRHIRFIEGELVVSSPSTDLRFIINPNRKWYYPRTTSDGEMHTYTVYLFVGDECVSHLDTPEFKVLPIWKEERRAAAISSATENVSSTEPSALKLKLANFKATNELPLSDMKVPNRLMQGVFPPPPPPRFAAAVPPYLGNVILAQPPQVQQPSAVLASVSPLIGPPGHGSTQLMMPPSAQLGWQAVMPSMVNTQHVYPGQVGFPQAELQHHHLLASSPTYGMASFSPVSSVSLQPPYIGGPNQSPPTTMPPSSQPVLPSSPSSLPHYAPPQTGPNNKLLGQPWYHQMPYPQAPQPNLVKYQSNQMRQQRQNNNRQFGNNEANNE